MRNQLFPLLPILCYNWEEGAEGLSRQSSGILLAIHLWRGQTTSRVSRPQRSLGVGDLRNRELDEKRHMLSYVHGVLHTHRSSDMYRHGREICPQRNHVLGWVYLGSLWIQVRWSFWASQSVRKPFKYVCLEAEEDGKKCTVEVSRSPREY